MGLLGWLLGLFGWVAWFGSRVGVAWNDSLVCKFGVVTLLCLFVYLRGLVGLEAWVFYTWLVLPCFFWSVRRRRLALDSFKKNSI